MTYWEENMGERPYWLPPFVTSWKFIRCYSYVRFNSCVSKPTATTRERTKKPGTRGCPAGSVKCAVAARHEVNHAARRADCPVARSKRYRLLVKPVDVFSAFVSASAELSDKQGELVSDGKSLVVTMPEIHNVTDYILSIPVPYLPSHSGDGSLCLCLSSDACCA